jgi:hypothetical protein
MKRICFLFCFLLSINVFSAPECQTNDDCEGNPSGPICWGGSCGFIVINKQTDNKELKYMFCPNFTLSEEMSEIPKDSLPKILEINSSTDASSKEVSHDI